MNTATSASWGSNGTEELVGAIKAYQRSGEEQKLAWGNYCNAYLGGSKDPSRATAEQLETFIASVGMDAKSMTASAAGLRPQRTLGMQSQSVKPSWGSASWSMGSMGGMGGMSGMGGMGGGASWATAGAASGGSGELADFVKVGQRKSPMWRDCWSQYREKFSKGKNDPAAHPEAFLLGFVEFLAKRGLESMNSGEADQLFAAGDAMAGGPGMQGMKRGASDEPLVQAVKQYQRSGEVQKQAWWVYCDTYLAGSRDPARATKEQLQFFMKEVGLDPDASIEEANPYKKARTMAMPYDPVHQELANKVKAYSMSGADERACWISYSDTCLAGTRDPTRATSEQLMAFMGEVGLE